MVFSANVQSHGTDVSLSDFTRLVEHLIINAFYDSPSGSKIRITLTHQNRTLVVKNQGIGNLFLDNYIIIKERRTCRLIVSYR